MNLTDIKIWLIRALLPPDWYNRKEYAKELLPRGRRLPVETRRKKVEVLPLLEGQNNA